MKVNNNNYNYNLNFGANKITTVQRIVEGTGALEKYDVYRLNQTDVPFVRKIASFMESVQEQLNECQKKILENFKIFLKESSDYDGDSYTYFVPKSMYIGIKNDETITGLMRTESKATREGLFHSVMDLIPNSYDNAAKNSFIYTLLSDKQYNRGFMSDAGVGFNFNKYVSRDGAKLRLKHINPDCKFSKVNQNPNYDLEDVFDIKDC